MPEEGGPYGADDENERCDSSRAPTGGGGHGARFYDGAVEEVMTKVATVRLQDGAGVFSGLTMWR